MSLSQRRHECYSPGIRSVCQTQPRFFPLVACHLQPASALFAGVLGPPHCRRGVLPDLRLEPTFLANPARSSPSALSSPIPSSQD